MALKRALQSTFLAYSPPLEARFRSTISAFSFLSTPRHRYQAPRKSRTSLKSKQFVFLSQLDHWRPFVGSLHTWIYLGMPRSREGSMPKRLDDCETQPT